MTNSQNIVKNHETSVKNANHQESVNEILSNVENTPFALRGATTKSILYFLFSLIAAVELSAALFFYVASLGVSKAVALVVCGLLAFGFHALLHSILTDTSKGIVFGKRSESGAMSNEVTANIVLSIVLLLIAACSVFFIGKKGFTAYRATQYEKKIDDEKGKLPPVKSIDASMLTGKNGKIAAWKLETLTDLEKAKATATEKQQAKDEGEASRYDATTATITDIVGASAFLIELLLALLAYTIATAKKAAVIEEVARRKTSNDNGETASVRQQALTANVEQTDIDTPSVQKFGYSENNGRTVIRGFQRQNDTPTASVKQQTTIANVDDSKKRICLHCEEEYIYKIHNQKFCCEDCRIAAWEAKTGKRFKKMKT